MKRFAKPLGIAAAALVMAAAALFAFGVRLIVDPGTGKVFVGRPVTYVNGQAATGKEPKPAGPLQSIQILTPDPVIRENMDGDRFVQLVQDIAKAAEGALAGSGAKIRLTVTFHPKEETDNVVEAEEKDAAAAQRLADAVDAVDKDVRTKASDVSVRFLFDASAAPPGRSITIKPGQPEGPGEPLPSPEDEKAAMEAVRTLATPAKEPPPWEMVTCNPAFWERLKAKDPAIAGKGISTKTHVDETVLEARIFAKNQKDGLAVFASPGFQALMKEFAAGNARAATKGERRLIYAMIPFEIKGKPATVIEKGADLLYITPRESLLWLDVVSDYGKPAPAAPVAPAAAEPAAATESVAAQEPTPAPDSSADDELRNACSSEIGIFCPAAGEDGAAVRACLRKHKVLRACAKALK